MDTSASFPGICPYQSRSGWIITKLFETIIRKHFCPLVCSKRNQIPHLRDKRVLLFTEGHISRYNVDLIEYLISLSIDLFVFPPNATKIMQPLDVSCFRVFKNRFRPRLFEVMKLKMGDDSQYQKYRSSVATALLDEAPGTIRRMSTIQQGFRDSGLVPLDESVVLKNNLFIAQEKEEFKRIRKRKPDLSGLITTIEMLQLLRSRSLMQDMLVQLKWRTIYLNKKKI